MNFHRSALHGRNAGLTAVAMGSLLLLSGCATDAAKVAQSEYDKRKDRTAEFQTAAREPQRNEAFVKIDSTPRFASRSIPLQKASALPANIGRVTLRYPGRHSMAATAEMISRLVDIPVIMTADALMDASNFAPLSGTLANAKAKPVENRATTVGALAVNVTPSEFQNTIELDYSGNLGGLLDYVGAKAGLQWQYVGGKIVFSRVITRSIALKALPSGLKTSGSLSLDAGGSGDSGGGGSSPGLSISSDTDSDVWAGLADNIKSMLSTSGRVQVDPKSGLVTVTDAVTNVEKVESFIESLNANILRQVVLEVEVLQVNMGDEYSNGINWSAVFKGLQAGNASVTFTGPQGPGSISGNAPGSMAFSMASRGGKTTTSMLIEALQEYGRVGTSYSSVVTTVNRMPVPIGSIATQSYLKETTPAVVSGSNAVSSASAGLTPGTISTGFTMMLLPVILDSNRILLQSSLQISALQKLTTLTSGTGLAQQSIQLPSVDKFVTMQRMSVKAGDTLVLVGYEREFTQLDDTDIVRNLVPVSRRGNRAKQSTIILVTPRLTGA